MLQQTQVATVIKYFDRFIDLFPDVFSLHRASRDEVLSAWHGLGYYRRALNLHETATVIVRKHSGKFPQTISELCALPGIGRSTAGSILAAAWNTHAPILDANVRRVLSRFHGVNGPGLTKISDRKLWEIAESHTPQDFGRDYNQSIMDFGALWCTLAKPKCAQCPVNLNCIAYQNKQVAEFPTKKRTVSVRLTTIRACVVFDQHFDCLLRQRGSAGIYAQMWDTPELVGRVQLRSLLQRLELPTSDLEILDRVDECSYRISNQKISEKLTIAKYSVPSNKLGTPANTCWTPFSALNSKGLSVRTKKRIQLARTLVEPK